MRMCGNTALIGQWWRYLGEVGPDFSLSGGDDEAHIYRTSISMLGNIILMD